MEVGSLSFAYSPARTMAARNSSTSEDLILVENGSRIPILFSEGISFQCLFLSLTHSLSLFLSLSLSLSRSIDDSIPEELSEGRHTDLSRECIVSSHHLFPRIRKGEGLSLSLSLSFRASEAEDRGRVSFLKDAELEGVGYPFTD